jgi:hypothetical protein
MLIFGNPYIESPKFIEINTISQIDSTNPKDILLIEFKEPFSLAKYCFENNLEYAIEANSIKDALLAINLGCSFIIANLELAKTLQKIANEYLWDSKILVKIKDDSTLEKVALNYIDGVIYQNHIERIN